MWRTSVILLIFAAVVAAAPTSQPTTQLAIGPWLANLANADADQRDEARAHLLGLSRADLPVLRDLVEKNRPLAPAQAAALHDIVVHVYLTGEPYDSEAPFKFLGLRWADIDIDNEPPRLGVPVDQRIPGFPAFGVLREGDLILGVLLEPDAPLQQLPNLVTSTHKLLQSAVESVANRDDIVLEVLRQGQRLHISIRLAAKPKLPTDSPLSIPAYFDEWQKKGEDYWQAQFLPLLRPGVS